MDASASATNAAGGQACPFPTITEALALANNPTSLVTIHVAPGTYSTETFPMVVTKNEKLIGEGASTRDSFVIDGEGTAGGKRFVVALHGEIDFMHIQDSSGGANPDYIVYATSGTPHLSLSTVDGKNTTSAAVFITSNDATATVATIDNQTIVFNSDSDGIDIAPGTTAPTVTIDGAIIRNNVGDGVKVTKTSALSPTVNMNGSTSANAIYCNQNYGVNSAVSVNAQANGWDHATPNDGVATGGPPADVNDATLVDTTNFVAPDANACNQ